MPRSCGLGRRSDRFAGHGRPRRMLLRRARGSRRDDPGRGAQPDSRAARWRTALATASASHLRACPSRLSGSWPRQRPRTARSASCSPLGPRTSFTAGSISPTPIARLQAFQEAGADVLYARAHAAGGHPPGRELDRPSCERPRPAGRPDGRRVAEPELPGCLVGSAFAFVAFGAGRAGGEGVPSASGTSDISEPAAQGRADARAAFNAVRRPSDA